MLGLPLSNVAADTTWTMYEECVIVVPKYVIDLTLWVHAYKAGAAEGFEKWYGNKLATTFVILLCSFFFVYCNY